MTCKLCPKTAWYQVPRRRKTEFFCGDHKKEAIEACSAENRKNESEYVNR